MSDRDDQFSEDGLKNLLKSLKQEENKVVDFTERKQRSERSSSAGSVRVIKAADKNTVKNHPDWPEFVRQEIPDSLSFSYTNEEGHESYWTDAPLIKIKSDKLILMIEGEHGDPLNFDIRRIMDASDARTNKKVQGLFFDLVRMWKDTHEAAIDK